MYSFSYQCGTAFHTSVELLFNKLELFLTTRQVFTQESFNTKSCNTLKFEHTEGWPAKAEPQGGAFRYLWSHLRKSWGMSCIVSERGTQVSTPIFHVFCTRKIFFLFPRNNCLSGFREIAKNSRKIHMRKKVFFRFFRAPPSSIWDPQNDPGKLKNDWNEYS